MSALFALLNTYRSTSVTEREKGTYFEELICAYLRNEATYRDLYDKVWMYGDWAKEQGLDGRDTGIDLVARTQGTGEYHAISPRQPVQTMITSPPAQLDRLMERQRPGHRPTAMAAGCFGGLPWAGLQLRLMTLSFNQLIVLGDKKGDAPKLFDNFSQGPFKSQVEHFAYRATSELR